MKPTQSSYEWHADEALVALLRRYYSGEAALWPDIQQHIATHIGLRGIANQPYHIRLLRTDTGYIVRLDQASDYLTEQT